MIFWQGSVGSIIIAFYIGVLSSAPVPTLPLPAITFGAPFVAFDLAAGINSDTVTYTYRETVLCDPTSKTVNA